MQRRSHDRDHQSGSAVDRREPFELAAGTVWSSTSSAVAPKPTWPDYDERDRSTLVIDEVDRIEWDPRRGRRRAWNRFLPALAG